jgi:hypothetical protein
MIRTRLLILCLLASGTALAQPGSPTGDEPPIPVPQPPEVPQPRPPQPPQPPVERDDAPSRTAPAEPEADRPTAFSIGIGVGYRFPTSVQTPNITSVRFRLPNGITFEPTLVFATSSQSVDVGTTVEGTATEVGIGAQARFSLVKRHKTDLELLAGFRVDNLSEDPSDQNLDDKSGTTTARVSYGIAVGYWLTPHFQMSLSAGNDIVSYTHRREEMGSGFVSVTNNTSFGLIFDPSVALMIHLYN